MLKSTFADNKGLSSFVAVVAAQICEIKRNFPKMRTYSSSESSRVTYLGANQKRICNFLGLLVIIVTLDVSPTFVRYWRIWLENRLLSRAHPRLRPRSGEPVKISGWNLVRERNGATVWWKFRNPNFNHFWRIAVHEGRTDGQAIIASAKLVGRFARAL